MSKVEVIVSESSKKDARKLDDTEERVSIRRERYFDLDQAEHLNGFEQLVKQQKIKLDEPPHHAIGTRVGSTVRIDRGHGAYCVTILFLGEPDQQIFVDLDETRSPVRGSYKIIFQGPVDHIKFRHPDTNKLQISRSELIHFTVLERKHNTVAFHDPRI